MQGNESKSVTNGLVNGLRRDTLDSYTSIRHNVDQALMEVRKRLKEVFNRKAMTLKQSVCVVLFAVQRKIFKSRPSMTLKLQMKVLL